MIPKFRAWDKKHKQIIKVISLNWYEHILDYNVVGLFPNTESVARFWDETIVMQSTGLKDKNGVEIYEGDIVRRRDFVCDEVYFNVGQISYSGVGVFAGQFIFKSQSGNIDGMYSRYGDEVIGNIYENPELLEVVE